MYDVAVVGGGIGGTGVAALLSRSGYKVLLIEKAKRVGGRCTSYERDGFTVPTYVHAFARVDRGPCADLARTIDEPLEWVREKVATFNLKGKLVPIPIGTGKGALKALGAMKVGWRDLFKATGIFKDMGGDREKIEREFDGLDVMTWLKRHTTNENIHGLIGFISAATFVLPPWEGSTGEYMHILRGMAKAGAAGYPRGECSAIPDAYLRGFEKAGGEIKRGRVSRIVVKGAKAYGVELSDGEEIEARAVISNAGVKTTVLDLVDQACFDDDYIKNVRALKSSWSAMVLKVALDKKITDLPATISMPTLDPVGYFETLLDGEVPDQMTLWVTIPGNPIPELSPKGKQLICAGTLLPYRPDVDWTPYLEAGFESLERLFHEMPKHVMWKETVTPAQIAARVGPSGAAIEVAQAIGQVGKDRPPIRSSVDGLYFVGSDVGSRAVGVELAARSAIQCAREVEKDLGQ